MLARLTLLPATIAVVALACAPPAPANEITEDLRTQITPTAADLVRAMKEEKLVRIKFGAFNSPEHTKTAYATGLKALLVEEFRRAAKAAAYAAEVVEANPEVVIRANMDFKDEVEDGEKTLTNVIQVKFQIEKSKGNFVANLSKTIVDALQQKGKIIGNPTTVAAVAGLTHWVPAEGRPGSKDEEVRAAVAGAIKSEPAVKPFVVVGGTKIQTAPGNPYAVEVLVTDEKTMPKNIGEWAAVKAAPVRTTPDNRNPLIDLAPGKAYALRVSINLEYSAFDAAVEATVDGLDVFHFVDDSLRVGGKGGKSKYPCYICPRAGDGAAP